MALIGVKNYPGWYSERPEERMPIMAGFNFPTFKILDVLSIEVGITVLLMQTIRNISGKLVPPSLL